MELGNNTIQSLSLGNTPISEVWFGNTRVYPTVIVVTYTLTNAVMNLSSGSQLLPDKSNYGYITATLNEYRNGTLYTSTTVTCTPQINSSLLSEYFSISGNNIYFNYDDYKGTDLYSIFGNTYTTGWNGIYNDISSSTVYLRTYSNRVESSVTVSTLSLSVTPKLVSYNGGQTTIIPSLTNRVTKTYSSRCTNVTTNHVGDITITCNGSAVTTTAQHQTASYYTIGETSSVSAISLTYIASFNSSSATTTIKQEGTVYFMELYDGEDIIEDGDIISTSDTEFVIEDEGVNNGNYTIEFSDSSTVSYTISGNIITITLTSETDTSVTISESSSGYYLTFQLYGE